MGYIFETYKRFEVVELEEFSGSELKIYSIYIDDEEETLFDKFLAENEAEFEEELGQIINNLEQIGHETGLKSKWFKAYQGNFGDGLCYLFDHPDKNLRLYFILFQNAKSDLAIILGGGGHKPPEAHALQEVDKLKEENFLLREIASILNKAKDSDEISISNAGIRMAQSDEDPVEESEDYIEPLIFYFK